MMLVGRPATELAALIRNREVSAVEVVEAHLRQTGMWDTGLGAFQLVRAEAALAEARALDDADDMSALPLAGVPIAIKDNVSVAGEPLRHGSLATSPAPRHADDELVRRLRAAGAIVVGKTRVPEFCAYGWTDSAFGVTRNPHDPAKTAGGSSGGSAAAVAAGMVPLAHGSDGGGSIRVPAACCGVVGFKPGRGVVPGPSDSSGWHGLSANGPLATTVEDAAIGLAVMAGRADLMPPTEFPGRLRVAVSTKPSFGGVTVDPVLVAAVRHMAGLLSDNGHEVVEADPPYRFNAVMPALVWRAFTGQAEESAGLRLRNLEARNRASIGAGRLVRRFGLAPGADPQRWPRVAARFFASYDVLLTPTLGTVPIPAEGWSRRSFAANMRNASLAPFTGPWNLAGFPAVALPAGRHPVGTPLSVQFVAPAGGELTLLRLARQVESLQPWPRHAAGFLPEPSSVTASDR